MKSPDYTWLLTAQGLMVPGQPPSPTPNLEPEKIVGTKRCDKCIHALLEDHGYSNYTVEGTTFTCKLALNPAKSFDRFYGDEQKLLFANKCKRFREGEPEFHDVDCPYECACTDTAFERKNPNGIGCYEDDNG